MDLKKCHACDRISHSLFTANCGHKTCFYCYKNNKPVHKCKKCNEKSSHSLSPLKNKSAQKTSHLQSQQTKPGVTISPLVDSDRVRAVSGRSNKEPKQFGQSLICMEHKQPLNMFCKNSKQILCSVCLCRKSKYAQQILPLRNAQQYLRKQNKNFRQQARQAQTQVQSAWRLINKNRQSLQLSIETHKTLISQFYQSLIDNLHQMQKNSIKLCTQYIQQKIRQYGQISDDLNYLVQTLKQYRENSVHEGSINQLAYYYTSFSVIKKTLDTLSFDYVVYDRGDKGAREVMLVSLDRELGERVVKELIKFRLDIPIKNSDRHEKSKYKSRSSSIRTVKNKISPDSIIANKQKYNQNNNNLSSHKKHKFSLCSNASVQYENEDQNLYKRLLKTRYKL